MREPFRVVACVVFVVLAGCSGAVPAGETTDTTPSATPDAPTTPTNGTLDVHFINVGQSVSTLVVAPSGETMLIDSGHFNDDGEYVLQYLQQQGIDRIDYFVVSHNDADHIGGNAAVINYYETEADGIGAVYDPGIAASTETYSEYLDAVEEHDVTLYETREGDSLPLAGVEVDVMGPPEPYLEGEARNENSIVLKLTYGQTSFLFTGDAEDDQEAYLVEEYGAQLNATILKAGHHGSASSTSGPLLDAAAPRAVIISSAYDSQYGHPDEETLQRLTDRSIPAFWTAIHGHTVLTSDGTSVIVATQQDAPTAPERLRDGEPISLGTTTGVSPRVTYTGQGAITTTATTTATDGGTTDGELELTTVNADAEGNDGENLNDEYIVFENTGDGPLDLSGWTVSDAAGATYTFPDEAVLEAGARLTLHTGSGSDSATDYYWGSGSPIWNNGGDTITVTDASGTVIVQEEYQ